MNNQSKLQRLLCVAVCFFCIGIMTAFAQEQKVTVELKNATLKQVFKSIEGQTTYRFSYRNTLVDDKNDITISKRQVGVSVVLNEALKGRKLAYTIVSSKSIVISDLKEQTTPSKNKRVSGTVKSANGESIIGANVKVSGTTIGCITDIDGNFTLEVPENAKLTVSYIGFQTQEIAINGKSSVNIVLEEDTEMLDEIVVIGYGSMKKKDLTGAVAAIRGEKLSARKTTQLSTALQGSIAGVMVTRDNNAPGAAASTIRVRGITTISDSSPLVIIDGIPGDIDDVNPNDVESMSVLKDASSASIYGSRAAAGVILITTKRATERKASISYNFEYGLEIPTRQPEYVGVKRFLETTNELRYNDNPSGGWNQAYSEDDVNNWEQYHQTNPDKYPMTDWVGMILKNTAPRQTHTISISGGTKAIKSSASFIYDKVDGLYANRYYERFMVRTNNDFTINKYLGATLDLNARKTKDYQPNYNPFSDMRLAPMVYPAVWENGAYAEGKSGSNPYAKLIEGGTKDEWYTSLGGRAVIDFKPIEGLKFSGVIAPNYTFTKNKTFKKAVPYYSDENPNLVIGYMDGGYSSSKLTEKRNDSYNLTIQGIVNYMKTLGKHDINLMAGYETYYSFNENLSAARD